MNDNIDSLILEINKVLSSTSYTGKSMKNTNDILMMNSIQNDLKYTSVGDKSSKRKSFLTITLPIFVDVIQNKTFDEILDNSDCLEGHGLKTIIRSNINDIYTRLEILLGLKLLGHTDTLTETSNLIDELYKRREIQNEQQDRNALNKFNTQ